MKRKRYLLVVVIICNLFAGCSAQEISKAIDQDLGTNTSSIAESIDELSNNELADIDFGGKLKDGLNKINDYVNKSDGENLSAGLLEVTVDHVTDGDTLSVIFSDGTINRVRLLTVCAEESVSADTEKNNEYGVAASDYLKTYLEGIKTVWLQYDTEEKDIYDRELCYVWLSSQVDTSNTEDIKQYMLNAILLQKGYVYTVVYEPNHLYAELFSELETEARSAKVGLWENEEFVNLAKDKQTKEK